MRGMRLLLAVTVVMGVLIVAGTATLAVIIFHRLGAATAPARPLVLNEATGTRIAGIAATADRLAVQLQGGGPDRVVLVDPHSGATVGTISLAH